MAHKLILGTLTALLSIAHAATSAPQNFGEYEGYQGPAYDGIQSSSYYVTMRDGANIAVTVMLPDSLPADTKLPTVMIVTRFWREPDVRWPLSMMYEPDEPRPALVKHGYAVVGVDARGSGASTGRRIHPWSPAEVEDYREIIDWIIAQSWSNGKVGACGFQYEGTAAEFVASLQHPAVKAIVAQYNEFDAYTDIAFPGGVMNDYFLRNWARFNGMVDQNVVPKDKGRIARIAAKGVKPVDSDSDGSILARAVEEHKSNNNIYDLARKITYRDDVVTIGGDSGSIDNFSVHTHLADINAGGAAVYTWTSWYAGGTANGAIKKFMNYTNPVWAVIGPWSQDGTHNISPYNENDVPTPDVATQWLDVVHFFDVYLKGTASGSAREGVLQYYTLGEEAWKSTKTWPPEKTKTQRLFFTAGNGLDAAPPESEGLDEYTLDFSATTGLTNRWRSQLLSEDMVYGDRAQEDTRLLTYTTPPLKTDIEITGNALVVLQAAVSTEDAALHVYLEDVLPSGKVVYLTEGLLRVLHRAVDETPMYKTPGLARSFTRAKGQPLTPGELTEINIDLQPVSALVRTGHRIRIAIAGADKDTFARVPATGTPELDVHYGASAPSYVDLPIIPR